MYVLKGLELFEDPSTKPEIALSSTSVLKSAYSSSGHYSVCSGQYLNAHVQAL